MLFKEIDKYIKTFSPLYRLSTGYIVVIHFHLNRIWLLLFVFSSCRCYCTCCGTHWRSIANGIHSGSQSGGGLIKRRDRWLKSTGHTAFSLFSNWVGEIVTACERESEAKQKQRKPLFVPSIKKLIEILPVMFFMHTFCFWFFLIIFLRGFISEALTFLKVFEPATKWAGSFVVFVFRGILFYSAMYSRTFYGIYEGSDFILAFSLLLSQPFIV